MTHHQTQAHIDGALGWIRCMEAGDFPGIFALHDEDVIVNLSGTTPVSGFVIGRDAYFEYTNAQVMGGLDPTKEPWLKGWRLACADHNSAAIFFNGSFPAKDGAPEGRYFQNYLAIVQACGKIIHKLTEMADTAMIETAVYRRRLKTPRENPQNPYHLSLVGPAENPNGSREQSLELAEKLLDSIRRHDRADYSALFHADLVANIVGRTPYSGRWHGVEDFLGTQFDFHSDQFAPESRIFARRYRIMCADEKAFCILLTGGGTTRSGKTYSQNYSIVGQVRDNKITEMHIHLDTAKAEDVIFDNPFIDPPKTKSPHKPFSIY